MAGGVKEKSPGADSGGTIQRSLRQGGEVMKARTIEKWIWPLIFGGLLVLVLGLAVMDADAQLGWSLSVLGGAAAALGVAFIFVRARMSDR
jgi:hypothetical protein